MNDAELETHYRRYISTLNAHRTSDLGDFVQDQLTYNGRAMTREDYQTMIAGDIAAIPDLHFDIDLLAVSGGQVGCRLNFTCTPTGTFLGLQPNGKTISFSEHVFYKLRDGKFYEVWSLIDRPAIETQLA